MLPKKLILFNTKNLIGSFKMEKNYKILIKKHKKRDVECFRTINLAFSNENTILNFG